MTRQLPLLGRQTSPTQINPSFLIVLAGEPGLNCVLFIEEFIIRNNEQCSFTIILPSLFSNANELQSKPKSFYLTGMHVLNFDSHFKSFTMFIFRPMVCESAPSTLELCNNERVRVGDGL